MTRYLTRNRLAIVAGLLLPLAAAAILVPFRSSWSNTNVALLLVVVVVGVSAIGSRVAGIVAALSAVAWFDFFFTVPYYRFTIRGSADLTTAILLLLTGLAVAQLAARARHLKVVTITDASYLTLIHEAAAMSAAARSPAAIVAYINDQLVGLLGLESARFEYGALLGHPPRLEPDGSVTAGRIPWDVDASWPAAGGDRAADVRQRALLRPVHAQGPAGHPAVAPGPPGRRHAGRPGRPRPRRQPRRRALTAAR